MALKVKNTAIVRDNSEIGTGIHSMWLEDQEIAGSARPGQFVCLYTGAADKLLPRPISICEIKKESGLIRLVFRIVGAGTERIAGFGPGDPLEVMGPLGNGFFTDGCRRAILIGGGIGIPPMLELAKQLACEKSIVLGYRDELFLNREFEPYGSVYLSTEDGSCGTKGNVIDALRENAVEGDMIFACGPTPMLRGVKAYAQEKRIPAQLSLEERMACGIGACLACVCRSKDTDEHTNVKNKRICKDGPVFYAEEVEL